MREPTNDQGQLLMTMAMQSSKDVELSDFTRRAIIVVQVIRKQCTIRHSVDGSSVYCMITEWNRSSTDLEV